MTYYIIQTLLLLVVAYFLGAWIGCVMRSLISYRSYIRDAAFATAGDATPLDSGVADETFAAPKTSSPSAADERGAPTSAKDKDAGKDGAPEAEQSTHEEDEEIAKKRQAIEAAALAAATAAAATITGEDTEKGASDSSESTSFAGGETSGEDLPDNLQRIKGISPALAGELEALGVSNYAQIAEWTSGDVAAMSEKLELAGRIGKENWIEQAKILGSAGVTAFARNFDHGRIPSIVFAPEPLAPRPDKSDADETEEAGYPSTASLAVGMVAAVDGMLDAQQSGEGEDSNADDLTAIKGIDPELAGRLAELGIERFEQIAAWTADDVQKANAALGYVARIQRENWVEQASLLASGKTTLYAWDRSGD
ncbi:MAG: helix-hairpin-helix domain-containing protein [Methyloligellaceae bacterium]